jgi:hypothetical protein
MSRRTSWQSLRDQRAAAAAGVGARDAGDAREFAGIEAGIRQKAAHFLSAASRRRGAATGRKTADAERQM